MTGEPGEHLTERRTYVIVLSLVIDPQHRLIQGELSDPQSTARIRFRGWRGLLNTLRAWILATDTPDRHPSV